MGIELNFILYFIYGIVGGLGIFLYGLRLMVRHKTFSRKENNPNERTTGSPLKVDHWHLITAIIQ